MQKSCPRRKGNFSAKGNHEGYGWMGLTSALRDFTSAGMVAGGTLLPVIARTGHCVVIVLTESTSFRSKDPYAGAQWMIANQPNP